MREEIIRMAKQAGDVQKDWKGREGFAFDDEGIHRFAALVAAAKKEECANKVKALIDVALETADGDPLGEYISKAIRAL